MIKNLKVENVDCLHGTIVTVNNFNDYRKVLEPFNNDLSIERFNLLKENGEVLGYHTDNNIVGILSLMEGELDKSICIPNIVVMEQYQERGYAKDLVNYFMHYFENQDYYNEVYFRTNGSKVEQLMLPFGFKVDENKKIFIKKRGENNELRNSRKAYFL